MFSKNPNRSALMAFKPNANLATNALQPTPQQLNDMLKKANERIAELETRLQQIERCLYVAPAGDVEISSPTQIRIVAGVKVEVVADHSVNVLGNQEVKLGDQNGNSVRLSPGGISGTAAAVFKIDASTIQSNTGMLTVNAGMSRFSGTVQCDTIIANSVVGSSYTPGAGNIW